MPSRKAAEFPSHYDIDKKNFIIENSSIFSRSIFKMPELSLFFIFYRLSCLSQENSSILNENLHSWFFTTVTSVKKQGTNRQRHSVRRRHIEILAKVFNCIHSRSVRASGNISYVTG